MQLSLPASAYSSSFVGSCTCSSNLPSRRVTGSWSGRVFPNKNGRLRVLGAIGERTTGDAVEGSGAKGESIGGSSGGGGGAGFSGHAVEVTTFEHAARFCDGEFPVWEKIGAVVRLSYGIGIYVAMALAGRFLCSFTGIDSMGGFNVSLDAILQGLGYAVPPIMALLLLLDDEVVKLSPHARAIRDVEDEELWSFFYGMSPWQFILIVAASSVGEALFYRAAIQGILADVFLRNTDMMAEARGLVSLTGVFPPFVPFAQAFAAVITAVLTGSLYYLAASPRDPTYIVAPVVQSHSGQKDIKKLFSAWYERRQLKKIYSPLLEGFLALYLGFEWIETNNILAPILTHGIYSTVILGHGLWKIHDHRRRLRQRIRRLKQGTDSASE
ncbi:hypothetical protein MLD38_023475 [Melastoma candidum]|uniref:Uncharacterized protein n=1 Tax=Melastoma candidum TaxID=119954 RepID=A0ACB9NR26_9MYRT|nr:hypothetical protein MLD38_023475 [Melastoma candidum]